MRPRSLASSTGIESPGLLSWRLVLWLVSALVRVSSERDSCGLGFRSKSFIITSKRTHLTICSIVGVSNQLSWISIGITSIRFRQALALQGKTHLLPFKNWTYPYGPWICVILNSFLVLVQGWSCFSPKFDGVSFVSFYIELPVMLIMFVVWKLVKKTKIVKLNEMDLETDVYTVEEKVIEETGWKTKVKNVVTWLF
jgi:amino acid permease